MSSSKPVLFTGIKPTGDIHIGNYFGAIKQLVDLAKADAHEVFVMIADYHALNFIQDASEMKRLSYELTATYIACGLDPEKVTIFKQSAISAHTELTWIFDTITTMPYLMRAHAFKDAEAKSKEISVGAFNYPMLMAADILLYDAAVVPVGQDQKQHVEYTRDTAEKFNRVFAPENESAETFVLPEAMIMPEVAVVPGTDGQKMSKSYGNTIPLFASREEITHNVMGIVTDSSGSRPENVYRIHRLFKSEAELAPLYEMHEGKYKALKEALIEDIDAFVTPMRERYESISKDFAYLDSVLEKGNAAANEKASQKLILVKKAIGVA
jgi:tryptophanyl-tRNA synthetase